MIEYKTTPKRRKLQKGVSVAYHEAAHFVVLMLPLAKGHTSEDFFLLHGGKAADFPELLSIKRNAGSSGRMRSLRMTLVIESTSYFHEEVLAKAILSLASGYVASSILNRQKICISHYMAGLPVPGHEEHDFFRINTILSTLGISYTDAVDRLLDYTRQWLKNPAVWSIIELVASRLLEAKQLDESALTRLWWYEVSKLTDFDKAVVNGEEFLNILRGAKSGEKSAD